MKTLTSYEERELYHQIELLKERIAELEKQLKQSDEDKKLALECWSKIVNHPHINTTKKG